VTHASISFTGCGSNSAHDNCTVTVEEQPLFHLLATEFDAGILLGLSGAVRFKCVVFGFIKIDCLYNFFGVEFGMTGGNPAHITAEGTPFEYVEGSGLCPEESSLDFLLQTLEETHIGEASGTALCKAHSAAACAKKDLAKSLHMVTTKPPLLLNTVANVECESSLATATVLGLAASQKLDVTELTWSECHTQGASDNCTVTSKSLPALGLTRTALNLGTVAVSGLKVAIDCTVLGLIELDCVYGSDVTLQAEGALHKTGTGHGLFTAAKVVLEKLEGTGHCPESVKWDASYEPLEHVYIVE
jgi:hypothetical protein